VVIPADVIWAYGVGGLLLAIGLAVVAIRGEWQLARGADKLLLLGPLFYAAPLGAFGTEHFTRTRGVASIVPAWIPWHEFWAYFVGACFIAAAIAIVTKIQTQLAASLVGLTFFLFVVLMDVPAWARRPADLFALTLALRELAFSGGALALAATLTRDRRARGADLATVARYFVAVPVLVYSLVQFVHGDHVPGVPLRPLTPSYVVGHSAWAYLAAAGYAVTGVLLIAGRRTRAAATWLGAIVLIVVLGVYVPVAVVERASLDRGFNFLSDTLMFGGAALLLAAAMPRESPGRM